MNRFAIVVAAALLCPVMWACEDTPPPRTGGLGYTANAQHAYDEAMKEFNAHNWAESQPLFTEVKRKFSYTRFARLAELRIADADFEQEKFVVLRIFRTTRRRRSQVRHDHRATRRPVWQRR